MNRNPLLTVLMAVGGVILLLPGLCAIAVMGLGGMHGTSELVSLWFFCFLISAGGVVLLRKAFR